MVRWEPGARERLQRAALDLFASQGFEQTTAQQIAVAAGLTERTFFRHFADKREVLFDGQDQFVTAFLAGLDKVPPGAAPLELVAAALRSAADLFPDERRAYARLRQNVIDQNPALLERERHKLAYVGTAVADALRARGIDDLRAALAAQSGTAVFGIAFALWIRDGENRSLADLTSEVLGELSSLASSR